MDVDMVRDLFNYKKPTQERAFRKEHFIHDKNKKHNKVGNFYLAPL